MKKQLFTLMTLAVAFAASAEVTTFVPQASPLCRYDGTADQMVSVPVGFSFRFPSDTKQRVPNWDTEARFIEKSIVSDRIELWGHHLDGITAISCEHVSDGSLRWYWNRGIEVIPAQGLTVTGVRIHLERPDNSVLAVVEADGGNLKVLNTFAYNPQDTLLTLSCNYDKPFYICNMGENSAREKGTLRVFSFEVTTTGTSTQCAIPEYNITRPLIGANEMVELSCPTEGAKIYYTIDYNGKWDGSRVGGGKRANDPTTESTLYTGPFSLEKDAIVRAIAVKDGMANSFVTYQEYYVAPEHNTVAEFDFTDHTAIKDEEGNQIAEFATYPIVNTEVSTSTVEKVSIVSTPAFNNGVTLTGTITNEKDGTGCDITLSNTFGGVVELRPLKGASIFISVPDDCVLSGVYMEASVSESIVLAPGMPGTYKNGFVTSSRKIWTADEANPIYELELYVSDSSQYVDRFFVTYNDPNAGVSNVAIDSNAPVEYYNLQGFRVANPEQGRIYIKRQGSVASKVIL